MALALEIRLKEPNAFKDMVAYGEDFDQAAVAAHDMWVLRILEYMAKFSRVRTGLSRAGWFNFMDLKGYDYTRSLPPTSSAEDLSDEGRGMGMSFSEPFSTTIINNVKYVEPMNARFGLFGFANTTSGKMYLGSEGIRIEEKIPMFEQYGEENFEKFMTQAKEAFENGGGSFKPSKIEPILNDPPLAE